MYDSGKKALGKTLILKAAEQNRITDASFLFRLLEIRVPRLFSLYNDVFLFIEKYRLESGLGWKQVGLVIQLELGGFRHCLVY